MAKRTETIVHLVDDLDGGKAQQTVPFSVDGKEYEIDLSGKNRRAMEKALKPFIEAAREVKAPRRKPTKRAARSGPAPAAVREWASANGVECNDRGRVPTAVIEQYEAAQSS